VPWLHCQKIAVLRVLGSVVIQFYVGECTPSVGQALFVNVYQYYVIFFTVVRKADSIFICVSNWESDKKWSGANVRCLHGRR